MCAGTAALCLCMLHLLMSMGKHCMHVFFNPPFLHASPAKPSVQCLLACSLAGKSQTCWSPCNVRSSGRCCRDERLGCACRDLIWVRAPLMVRHCPAQAATCLTQHSPCKVKHICKRLLGWAPSKLWRAAWAGLYRTSIQVAYLSCTYSEDAAFANHSLQRHKVHHSLACIRECRAEQAGRCHQVPVCLSVTFYTPQA